MGGRGTSWAPTAPPPYFQESSPKGICCSLQTVQPNANHIQRSPRRHSNRRMQPTALPGDVQGARPSCRDAGLDAPRPPAHWSWSPTPWLGDPGQALHCPGLQAPAVSRGSHSGRSLSPEKSARGQHDLVWHLPVLGQLTSVEGRRSSPGKGKSPGPLEVFSTSPPGPSPAPAVQSAAGSSPRQQPGASSNQACGSQRKIKQSQDLKGKASLPELPQRPADHAGAGAGHQAQGLPSTSHLLTEGPGQVETRAGPSSPSPARGF